MDVKECTERGLKNLQTELKVSSEGIVRVGQQIKGVQESLQGELQNVKEEIAQKMEEGVQCLERVHERTERIDEGVGRLEREIQGVQGSVSQVKNEFKQLRELIIRRPGSSSAEPGARLRISIESESITGPHSQATGGATALHVQPTPSCDIPSEPAAQGNNSQCFPNEQQHVENIRRALIVNIDNGSLVLTVKCNSLEIIEGLWEDYSTGLLGELAQKFLVTDEILEELGLFEGCFIVDIHQRKKEKMSNQSENFRDETIPVVVNFSLSEDTVCTVRLEVTMNFIEEYGKTLRNFGDIVPYPASLGKITSVDVRINSETDPFGTLRSEINQLIASTKIECYAEEDGAEETDECLDTFVDNEYSSDEEEEIDKEVQANIEKPCYYPAQIEMAAIMKKRIDTIMSYYHNIPRLSDVFNDVEFVVYTARYKMLSDQTEKRICHPNAGVLSREELESRDDCNGKKRMFMYVRSQETETHFEELKTMFKKSQKPSSSS
ncbi:hypothetical protein OS493_004641 [Desmophyllum pertusum]|uniref:Uncharacterized protein n=1 Tax=Desmophyllum pertusum TaxID=174260 RepID=A0A9X0CZ96_9CNID|nr:hypothetical protein OS493_004641 [Desmophyllum pertusum]